MSGDQVLCSYCDQPVSLDEGVWNDDGFYHKYCLKEMDELDSGLDSPADDL
jgi:hypothetical protein